MINDRPVENPQLQKALNEIQQVLSRYGFAGTAMVVSDTEAAWLFKMHAPWSAIRYDPETPLGFRIRAKSAVDGKELAQAWVEGAMHTICQISDYGEMTVVWMAQLKLHMRNAGVQFEHTPFGGEPIPSITVRENKYKMSRWLRTDGGIFVNLDHAESIEPIVSTVGSMVITMADGRTYHCSGREANQIIQASLAPWIPATKGQIAVVVLVERHAYRPTETEILRLPIIGWRQVLMGNLTILPVLPGDIDTHDLPIAVELPAGYVFEPLAGMTYSLGDFLSRVLAVAQADWDRKHEPDSAQ